MVEAAFKILQNQVGAEFGPSTWTKINQAMIDQFADVIEDHQWIHTDPSRASATPFGGTIAHGFLTLSLSSKMAYELMPKLPGQEMGINYGLNKVRFLAPVRVNDRVRGRFSLTSVERRDANSLLSTYDLSIEIAGHQTPALVATWLGLARF